MLQDPATRRRFGLPEAPAIAKLEDSAATLRTTPDRGWAKSDITVSTSADQVPIASGNKVSDVVRGGRRIARFVSGVPVQPRLSVQSARYAGKHRVHRGVDLAVYHHPGHAWNVDRMLDALAVSLDYFQENFGPYPFHQARIVEFPGYLDFAQAFPGTIPWSEDVGFVYEEPKTIDFITRKGARAMYLLQVRLGEDRVNRALRSLLARYRFRHAPFPRSLDLVAALRAEARTAEEQQLITDLFERVTLYDLKVTAPTAVRRADGRWDVTVPVEARKLYADGRGGETEAPLNERIEIGLFSAEPGPGVVKAKHVIVMERRPVRAGAPAMRFVTGRRPRHAYIAPHNYYIDRNLVDNVLRLADPE